jgi:hypothetical protein
LAAPDIAASKLAVAGRRTIAYLTACNASRTTAAATKLQIAVFAVIVATASFLSLKNYNSFQLGTYVDDANYVILAQSIASSDRYGLINAPGPALRTRYPFGYPLLLSPIAGLWPDQPDLTKLVSLAATLLNAGLLFWGWPYLSQGQCRWWGLLSAALYSTSPLGVQHTRMVMSEPVFLAQALGTLILVERCCAKNAWKPVPLLALGALAALAVFSRTAGIALWLAVAVRILLVLRSRAALPALGYVMLGSAAFTTVVVAITPVASSDLIPVEYAIQFQSNSPADESRVEVDLATRAAGAISDYGRLHLREAIIPLGGGASEIELGRRLGIAELPSVTGLAVAVLIATGSLAFLAGRGVSASVLVFELFTFGGLLMWTWRGSRFLYPVQPFLYYQFLMGIWLIAVQISHSRSAALSQAALGLTASAVLIASLYKGIRDTDSSLNHSPDQRIGTAWLRDNSPPDAVIMTQYPQAVYLYSQRKTIDYPLLAIPDDLGPAIDEQAPDFLFVTPRQGWHNDGSLDYSRYARRIVLPALGTLVANRQLKLVYEAPEHLVYIYQVQGSQ